MATPVLDIPSQRCNRTTHCERVIENQVSLARQYVARKGRIKSKPMIRPGSCASDPLPLNDTELNIEAQPITQDFSHRQGDFVVPRMFDSQNRDKTDIPVANEKREPADRFLRYEPADQVEGCHLAPTLGRMVFRLFGERAQPTVSNDRWEITPRGTLTNSDFVQTTPVF